MLCSGIGETQQPRRAGHQQRKRKRVQDLSSDEEEFEGTLFMYVTVMVKQLSLSLDTGLLHDL